MFINFCLLLAILELVAARNLDSKDNEKIEIQRVLQNLFSDEKTGHRHRGHHKHHKQDDHNLVNVQTLNMYVKHNTIGQGKAIGRNLDDGTEDYGHIHDDRCGCPKNGRTGDVAENVADDDRLKDDADDHKIESLLDDLEDYLTKPDSDARTGGKVFRCRGDRCEIDQDFERDSRDDMRCADGRCGGDEDRADDRDRGRNDFRCVGDRCGRDTNRDDEDVRDRADNRDRDDYRCVGDRCGRGRDAKDRDDDRNSDDNRDRDELRCVGDRCGRDRDTRNKDDDRDRDQLRCVGTRCGRPRNVRDRDDNRNRDEFRCVGDRCGRDRDGADDLRCEGDRCGGYRDHDREGEEGVDFDFDDENRSKFKPLGGRMEKLAFLQNIGTILNGPANVNNDKAINSKDYLKGPIKSLNELDPKISQDILKLSIDKYGKRYNVNKNLDAVVLSIDDLGKTVKALYDKHGVNTHDIQGNKPRSLDRKTKYKRPRLIQKLSPQISSLTGEHSGNNVEATLDPNELSEYLDKAEKQLIALGIKYATNPTLNIDIFLEHGFKLTSEERNFVNLVRAVYQKNKNGVSILDLRGAFKALWWSTSKKISDGVVLDENMHKTMLVPKWLFNEGTELTDKKHLRKNLLPLTQKQKLKLERGVKGAKGKVNRRLQGVRYGVPFRLEVEGLGQANP